MGTEAGRPTQAIAIVGMGRSGTTYLAEFLERCGVFLGEVNWAKEHELGRLINDTILDQRFGARPGRPYGKLPPGEIELPECWHNLARLFVRFMEVSAEAEGRSRFWAFKDPRTTLLHTIWLDHFDVIVGMFRSPAAVIASYLAQGWIKGFSRRRVAVEYWERFNSELLRIHERYAPTKQVYIIDYDSNMKGPLDILCRDLRIEATGQAESLYDPSFKHYRGGTLPKGRVSDLYDRLLALSLTSG